MTLFEETKRGLQSVYGDREQVWTDTSGQIMLGEGYVLSVSDEYGAVRVKFTLGGKAEADAVFSTGLGLPYWVGYVDGRLRPLLPWQPVSPV